MDFHIEVEQEEDGRWIAEITDISGCLAYGATPQAAIAKAKALALRVLADQLEENEQPLTLNAITFVPA
jgi:predicted RNase H-like HicB family nuclease